jgi:hypothetical protein
MCPPMMMHHGMGAMKGGAACALVGSHGPAMMGHGMGMHDKCCAPGTNAKP